MKFSARFFVYSLAYFPQPEQCKGVLSTCSTDTTPRCRETPIITADIVASLSLMCVCNRSDKDLDERQMQYNCYRGEKSIRRTLITTLV